jgi:steroid delta-isomerase-like uncharacterized protein
MVARCLRVGGRPALDSSDRDEHDAAKLAKMGFARGGNQMADTAAIATAVYDAWARRDFDAMVTGMADDVCVNSPGGVVVNGKADVKDWYSSWVTACPDSVSGAVCVAATADTAVVEGLYAGTNTGPFGPFPATGRAVSVPWTNVHRFDGAGRLVSVNVYYDQLTLMTQLGHMEAP